MKVVQITPSIHYGDAISNDIFAKDKILQEQGWQSEIWASDYDRRLSPDRVNLYTPGALRLAPDDLLIYRMSIGWEYAQQVMECECKKIGVYHNITPPQFFRDYSNEAFVAASAGLRQVQRLNRSFERCMADSSFNKNDLLEMEYICPIDVMPVIVDLKNFSGPFNKRLVERYSDGWTNLLFVGRLAPNKKQEDVILAYSYYKRYFNPQSRLFLVGHYMLPYYNQLMGYMEKLGLDDVHITGHIPFSDILAYYHMADALVCMSEHEGFCVPLLEAMHFRLPIVAYDAGAVGETLGDGGILLSGEKDPLLAAGAIDRVIRDGALREQLQLNQEHRLQDFSYETLKAKYIELMNTAIY